MISILIPERGRPAMLKRLIESLCELDGGSNNYEILVAIDEDDPAWAHVRPHWPGATRCLMWPRPITLGVKLNMLAAEARGDVLVFIGNDMVMETEGWPAKIQAAAYALPGGRGVPYLNSTLSPGEPTYPVITRPMMEAVGHFMDPAYPYWFIDTCWGEIGRMIGSLFPIDVTVSAPEGIGKTHAMVDLPFWVDYFQKTRDERMRTAYALGVNPTLDSVAECVRRTAHLSTPEFLARWGGTAESPPGPGYAEAKKNAERHLAELYPGPPDRNRVRYLDLLESVLTGTLTRDPPMDPWSGGRYYSDTRNTGRDWPATALTMIGTQRMRQLRDACETVLRDGVPGDFIETGVWRGGACIYMAAILEAWGDTNRAIWAADSFEGLPEPVYIEDRGDRHHTYQQLAISLQEVEDNFRRFGLSHRILPWKGWFKDTLPRLVPELASGLAILRLDGDMYQSTIEALDALYPKLNTGGICIVDDYFMAPCAQAVTDYRAKHAVDAPIQFIDGMGVWWRK
jgi:O-methyltransferase